MVLRSYTNLLELASGGGEPLPLQGHRRVPRVVTASGIVPDLDASGNDADGWDFEWDEDSLLLQVRDSLRAHHGRDDVPPANHDEVAHDLLEGLRCVPTFLPADLRSRFYHGFCKQKLWPLFHYMLPLSPELGDRLDRLLWQAYVSVNKICTDKILEVINPDEDLVFFGHHIPSPDHGIIVGFLMVPVHVFQLVKNPDAGLLLRRILMDHQYPFLTHRDLVDYINTRTKGVITDGTVWAIVTLLQDLDVCIPEARILNSREPQTLFNRFGNQAARQVRSCFIYHCLSTERLFGAAIATTTASSSSTSTSVGAQNSNEPVEWLLDSGSSYCVTGDPNMLHDPHYPGVVSATAATGQTMWSTVCGRAVGSVNLSGIRYFPGATMNLISQGFLVRLGCRCDADLQGLRIWKGTVLVGKGRLLPNNLWSVDELDERHLGQPACPGCWRSHQAH